MTSITPASVANFACELPPGVLEAAFKTLEPADLQKLNAAFAKADAADKSKSATSRAAKYVSRQDFNSLKKIVNTLRNKMDVVFESMADNKKKLTSMNKVLASHSSIHGSSMHRSPAHEKEFSAMMASDPDSHAKIMSTKTKKSGLMGEIKKKQNKRAKAVPTAGAHTNDEMAKRKIYYRFGCRKIPVTKPSKEIPPKERSAKPKAELALEYAFGFQGNDTHSRQNLLLARDGSKLVYYLAGVCVVHDIDSGRQRFFTGHNEDVTCITMHPKSTLVASGQVDPKGPEMPCIAIWDYNSPEEPVQIIEDSHDWEVLKVQFSPRNNYLYSMGGDDDHTLKIWDMETILAKQSTAKSFEPIAKQAPTSKEELFGFIINPYIDENDTKGGQLLDEFITYGRRSAKYWWVRREGKDDKGRAKFSIRGRQVVLGEFAPPAPKSAMSNKKARSRGGRTKKKTVFSSGGGQELAFHFAEFTKTGVYLLGGHSGTLYVAKDSAVVGKADAHLGEPVGCATLLSDSHEDFLTFGWKGTVKRWKLSGKKLTAVANYTAKIPGLHAHLTAEPVGARATAYDVEKELIYVGTKQNCIVRFDMKKSEEGDMICPPIVTGHEGDIWAVACHPSAPIFITGGHDRCLKVWDSNSNELLDYFEFESPADTIECATFSPDGKMLAVGMSDSKISLFTWEPSFERICDVEIPKKKKSSEVQEVLAVRFNPTGTMLAVCHDDLCAYIYDVKQKPSLSLVRWTKTHMDFTASPTHLRWSEDGTHLATFTRDYEIMHWKLDFENKTVAHELYSEDPDVVKYVGDPLIAGYDVMGCYQNNLGWDGTDLNYVALGAKRGIVASGDDFGTVRIHNYPALDESAHFAYSGHSAFVVGLGFVNDDDKEKYLISVGGGDKAIFKWRIE